jgi:hypothetical protein
MVARVVARGALLVAILLVGCGAVGGNGAGDGAVGPQGPQGPKGDPGPNPTWSNLPGGSPAMAGDSCAALLAAGMTLSGSYYVKNPHPADAGLMGMPVLAYCDQVSNGGGWALVHNSVLAPSTLAFWNILYADRLSRRGQPSISEDFYDGSLYQTAAAHYLDVVEDLQGKIVPAFEATSDGISSTTMKFNNPAMVSGSGSSDAYTAQFASGWSAPDYDGDPDANANCATAYNNVTQHYAQCWNMNLGSDADSSGGDTTDQGVGPHIGDGIATALGLASDGSKYTRVRRLSRFVKW